MSHGGVGTSVTVRSIPDPPGITTARTLPASWYASREFYDLEADSVLRTNWLCAGVTDELPARGEWTARTVAGVPVLLVCDRDGGVRAFLNVCRHRAAPLCGEGKSGSGSLIRCPYHAWLYRHDGSLAKAQGMGEPAEFDLDEHSLTPIGIATWRRFVFIKIDGPHDVFDLGPLADAVRACPIEGMQLVLSESDERQFNWKVLLENYSENYHTPFIHPEIDTSQVEDYPMVSDGLVLYAWDRLVRPGGSANEQIRASLLPGEPGWDDLFETSTQRPYDVGSYLTIWPNMMVNLFPDAVLAMWMVPTGPSTTVVERRLYVKSGSSEATIAGIIAAHRLVHEQDVDICQAVQRSHDAGLDARGRLATTEERGVYFIHEHLRAAVGSSAL